MSVPKAHGLMAFICIQRLRCTPSLLLRPWHMYHRETKKRELYLGQYASDFWYEHCLLAQGHFRELCQCLDICIRQAWKADYAANAFAEPLLTSFNIKLLVRNEGLKVGVEIAQVYELAPLQTYYERRGLHAGGLSEPMPCGPCGQDEQEQLDGSDGDGHLCSAPSPTNVDEVSSADTHPYQSLSALPIRLRAVSSDDIEDKGSEDGSWHVIKPMDYA
jgi:hypothetical protein